MQGKNQNIKGFGGFTGFINVLFGKEINHKQGGFTLIEVLVVVLIIGILTSIGLPQYQRAVIKSRLSQALYWAGVIRDAEHVYHDTYNTYTTDLGELDVTLPDCQKQGNPTNKQTADYICAQNYSIRVSANVDVVDGASVYVLIPGGSLGTEFYFADDTRLCYAPSGQKKYTDICTSMGATPYYAGVYFKFP